MTSSNPATRVSNWTIGQMVLNPTANMPLVQQPVTYGKKGYVSGFLISTNDPNGNTFIIQWINGGKVMQQSIVFGGLGTVNFEPKSSALNENYPADANSMVQIICQNAASAGKFCQASLLIDEVAF